MNLKYFNLDNNILKKNNLFLFYGDNEGLKNQIIKKLFLNKKIFNYDERELLENEVTFIEDIFSKSLFETEKILLIKRATDKILRLIDQIRGKNLEDIIIIINSSNLEKRSKLRNIFEKEKNLICVPFYPDNEQILTKLAFEFLKDKKISISSQNINLIVNKCNGDRQNLFNELKKIEFYFKNKKKISLENLTKLLNLAENHSVSELVDNCLAKNKKKTINIINENNLSNEDCVFIIRSMLNKSKKVLKLIQVYENNSNMDLTIASAKPPIFWKDKEITKEQIRKWTSYNIKELIYKLSKIEFLVKTNINNSTNMLTNFILEECS